MTGLLTTVLGALRGPCQVQPGDHLLVAVSGGRDSMILLRSLVSIAGEYPLQLSAVTVDHGLRDGVDAELDLVKRTCARACVPWSCRSVAVSPERTRAVGPEAAAREARHDALRLCAATVGAEVIALAHHLQDQAETVLMRALVGTGTRGLSAMAPRNGDLIRPLLEVDQDVLERFARDHGVEWIDDPTNAAERFLRNRVRSRLMPMIHELFGLSGARHLAALARRAAGDEGLLVDLARTHLATLADDQGWVEASRLEPMPPALATRVLHEMIRQVRPGATINQQHTDAVLALARGADRTAGVDLPGGLRVERVGDALRALGPSGTADEYPDLPLLVPGIVRWPVGGIRVRATVHDDHFRVAGDPRAANSRAWFDLDRLTTPLSMRKFSPGSRIRPFGSPGSRKISDLLGEAGIPRRTRPYWPVVTDAEQVLWVPGARAADVARVGDETLSILELTMG